MTKKFLTIFALIFLCSCLSSANKEFEKAAKQNAAASRINATSGNSGEISKELE